MVTRHNTSDIDGDLRPYSSYALAGCLGLGIIAVALCALGCIAWGLIAWL
jgi:hypothetical protein